MQVDDGLVIAADRASATRFRDEDPFDLLVPPRHRLAEAPLAYPAVPAASRRIVAELHIPVMSAMPYLDGTSPVARRGAPGVGQVRARRGFAGRWQDEHMFAKGSDVMEVERSARLTMPP
jgi:hypothetical protein